MPPSYQPLPAPEYDPSFDSTATGQYTSSYILFRPEVADKVQFIKPAYDRRARRSTVFRPFPCYYYKDFKHVPEANKEAYQAPLPYRLDPGGRNYFGGWLKRVYVAWNVGRPATTFIVHVPTNDNPYDSRLTPLGLLYKAVNFAIKKGQGKAQQWELQLNRQPFDPDAKTLLEWTGLKEGGDNQSAVLTMPKELFLMQGVVPQIGGELQFTAEKPMPGWGGNPTCVFGLTGGPGRKLFQLLNEEVPNYRGDPADFESRFVCGDPVAPDKGRYIFVYPKGGDPRQARYASQPQEELDPYAVNAAPPVDGSRGQANKEEIGFDLHLEKTFNGRPATMASPAHIAMQRQKWRNWDDVVEVTPDGRRVVHPGILYAPTHAEQARILGRILPADMLEYSFYGSHNDWLTDDILKKARNARQASVPLDVPAALRQASSYQQDSYLPPAGRGERPAVQAAAPDPFGGEASPAAAASASASASAAAAVPPPSPPPPPPPAAATPASTPPAPPTGDDPFAAAAGSAASVDDAILAMAGEVEKAFAATHPEQAAGFDPPPAAQPPASTSSRSAALAAALAAARAKVKQG